MYLYLYVCTCTFRDSWHSYASQNACRAYVCANSLRCCVLVFEPESSHLSSLEAP